MLSTAILLLLILYFYLRKYIEKKSSSLTCLVGKTALVTGGNSGLGYATCLLLASRGCKVIIADKNNAEKSRDEIIRKTANPNVIYEYLDLSSLQNVRDFSEHITKTEKKIDILINNAGIGVSSEQTTKDGLNYVMQVNYFGGFLLTHLLLGLLKASGSARIIFLGSALIYFHNLCLENLNESEWNKRLKFVQENYSNSKLCNVMAAQEFAKKLEKFKISAFSVDPGMVNTPIMQNVFGHLNIPGYEIFHNFWSMIIGLDPLTGAQTIFHLATSDEIRNKHGGQIYAFLRPSYKPPILKNQTFCDEIWKKSEDLVGLRKDEKLIAEQT